MLLSIDDLCCIDLQSMLDQLSFNATLIVDRFFYRIRVNQNAIAHLFFGSISIYIHQYWQTERTRPTRCMYGSCRMFKSKESESIVRAAEVYGIHRMRSGPRSWIRHRSICRLELNLTGAMRGVNNLPAKSKFKLVGRI
jgi:hypothetical protein